MTIAPTLAPTRAPTLPGMTTNRFAINLPINVKLVTEGSKYVPPFEFGIAGRGAYDYEWIYVCACIFAFICAAGIGANDVANAFATSVGSKTLKMWQAIVIAAFCEFGGAYLLGARVTATIRSSIIEIKTFTNHEDLLMFGMMCAIGCVGFWLFAATWAELPVSTTHSIIGAIIGFGLCSPAGGASVAWPKVGEIVGSWFLSPVLSGVIAGILFVLVRFFILRRDNALDRVFIFFPILVFITVTINLIFILYKGGIKSGGGVGGGKKLTDGEAIGIAFGVGAGVALILAVTVLPRLKRYIQGLSEEDLILLAANNGNLTLSDKDAARLQELQVARAAAAGQVSPTDGEKGEGDDDAEKGSIGSVSTSSLRKVGRFEQAVDKFFHQKYVHDAVGNSEVVAAIHEKAEAFPLKTEFTFGYLQVFTAMFASFAHGANDVANAIGPLAAVASIYENGMGSATKNSDVPDWILVLGGAGLVFGLAVYGHVIISAIGVKMVRITPARGFCMELAFATVIVLGSFLGLPLSTTHCSVGAIVGVGIAEGRRDSVNWKLFARVFTGWVFTLVVAGALTAAVYSFGTFSPSQIYPLSFNNCLAFYGKINNVTKGDPASYTQNVNAAGTIVGIYGYPSDGSMFKALNGTAF